MASAIQAGELLFQDEHNYHSECRMTINQKKLHMHKSGWRSRIFNRYTLILLIALLAIGGYLAWKKLYANGGELAQYQVAEVERGDIEELISATGTMQPRDYVDVGAQVSGQLKKIHVEIGSVVNAGDLLAEIDPTVFLANVDARRAQLRNLRATLKDRQAQLELAQLQLTRQKNLLAGDATTTEQVQTAEAALRSAKAQEDALKAQIEQNESTLRADEANLNYARIYAPIKGVVVSITARQGQTLNANQQAPTILRIADLSTMTVQTQVSEADVSQLRAGMDVYFTTLGGRGRRWYSSLRKVEPTPTVTNNVVLYNALFDIANTQRSLLPQMTAQVFFIAASARDVLTVPASAVTLARTGEGRRGAGAGGQGKDDAQGKADGAAEKPAQPGQADGKGAAADSAVAKAADGKPAAAPQVWAGVSGQRQAGPRAGTVKVINGAGKIEERQVQVGISNRVSMQVLSGLSEGEKVIAGVKQQGAARAGQGQQRNALQQGSGGMPGGRPR